MLLALFIFALLVATVEQQRSPLQQQFQPGGVVNNVNIGPGSSGNLYTGTGSNPYYGVNLVPFGPDVGDLEVDPSFLTAGLTIDLHLYFPFYGGLYNYTTLSINGALSFATILDQGPVINVGTEATDWPRQEDPAMIAPYLCKQQIPQSASIGLRSGVFYRLMMRQSLFGKTPNQANLGGSQPSSFFMQSALQACPNTADNYVQCDQNTDYFLDDMMRWLQDSVAGATMFRADAALVVTWYNTASAVSGRSDIDAGQLSTYQAIWLTDQTARLSYVILNYDRLGFDSADFRMNSRSGRCQALFNGGNHTGTVPVDPSQMFKNTPKVLAQRSAAPHMVRGRYFFRVDDIVRPGGCSNKTGGTYPMLIYPNIVNMLGETTVDVNAICLDRSQTYVLMISERQTADCVVVNPSIARCALPKIYDWGTKTVYFQPQSGGANDEKAFVGYIYFVPPTLDPMRLDIGNIYTWFLNPIPFQTMPLIWYPRNFTNPSLWLQGSQSISLSDDSIYSVQLGLYVIGYKEAKDDKIKKFNPENKVICRLATYANKNTYEYRYSPQEERININQVEHWYMTDWEIANDLYTYRFGYLKLAPLVNDQDKQLSDKLLSGLVSSPISIHWLWTINNPKFKNTNVGLNDTGKATYVKKKAKEMCHSWYDEDGAQLNFIRDTETNSSCPCIEKQAISDIGRFMPHPRCSQTFRDVTCTTMIGARNCYMSAQNVYSTYASKTFHDQGPQRRQETNYGQTCCYDDQGHLMQTTYQPVIKVIPETPYNPGYPQRAYEFGTTPFMGQYQVPGLSAFHNDYMPYYLCCKYADFRCQLFYWRRPSSACQTYQPAAYGEVIGAGSINTIDNEMFIFNDPGVYNFLYIPKTDTTPEVKVQIRMERYPDRRVEFGYLGRYISQADLVQPTNITVITGVAIEATNTDRVHVLARKDTRRFRYRTSIMVQNIMRYFDTMRIQRFDGVMVYVNNVERGQAEIYVVLEEAQIGLRIKESHNMDIDRLPMYQESMGMLDVEISVPPQYGVTPNGDKTREQEMRQYYHFPRVSGMIRPFPDQPGTMQQTMTLENVNSEQYRQQIINNYKIQGTGDTSNTNTNYNNNNNNAGQPGHLPTENMFITSTDDDRKFENFPESVMKTGPIYKMAPKYDTGPYTFVPITGVMLNQQLQTCRGIQTNNNQVNQQPINNIYTMNYAAKMCPDNPNAIIVDCGNNVPCLYDYTNFNSETLGDSTKDAWSALVTDRADTIRHYNSCGAINIEYPEYLMKTSTMSSAYMQGDVARFECYQSHWIKGTREFKCGIVIDRDHPQNYRFEWNKGNQPWCRARTTENYFIWLAAILGIIGVIIVIIIIFLICWIIKKNHREKHGGVYETKKVITTTTTEEEEEEPTEERTTFLPEPREPKQGGFFNEPQYPEKQRFLIDDNQQNDSLGTPV